MTASVRMKATKKQPAFATAPDEAAHARRLEQAVMDLEDAVYHVLNSDKGHAFHDVDYLYWHRHLVTIATQVSLALNEQRGPRRFHYHYRHDPKDHDVLQPVSGPAPLTTLTRVCREALSHCAEMVGMHDPHALATRNKLEAALRSFLRKTADRPEGH